MREIDRLLELSKITDEIIEMAKAEKIPKSWVTVLVEAIDDNEIKIESGSVMIPFAVFQKLFENNFQR